MNDYLKYKDYCGSIEIDMEAKCLHGKLLFIRDTVTYEASDPGELENAFKEAVKEYIQTCIELGREPQKPFSGTFNVRIGADLHKKAAMKARLDKFHSLNDFIKHAINQCLSQDNDQTIHHVYHIESAQKQEMTLPSMASEETTPWQIESIISSNQH